MKFGIIAAGEGSRLREEGIGLPKGLVGINGIPMIERIIRIAEEYSPNSINIIVNEQSMELTRHIRNLVVRCPVNVIVKSTPSSMHSLFELKKYLDGDSFCLFTVDTIFRKEEFDGYIAEACSKQEYDALMAVTTFIDDEKPLYIQAEPDMEITGFLDSCDNSTYISGGIYFFNSTVFNVLEQCINNGEERLRNFQRQILKNGLKAKAYNFSKIIDVDHIKDIKKAEQFLNEGVQ